MINIKISTNENNNSKLLPKRVKVIGIETFKPNDRTGKESKEKLVYVVKHPDREDPIKISKGAYLKDNKLAINGLWLSLDNEGNLPQKSCLATVLRFYDKKATNELVEFDTCYDENSYLVIKAY